MAHIHLLENNLIDKIAAGEVVERPASVVKELMENAIDAGATKVKVEITQGGTELIRITDNGRGIVSDEVETAFLRHATSKLNSIEDLRNILTLGFRGEALSSIAAVAEVEILTRTAEESVGTRFTISGGAVGKRSEASANVGTRITVRNLFFNTPVRLKFLKKPSTEGGYVSEAVSRIAIGHPELAVELEVNGSSTIKTNGSGDLKTAIYYVKGRDIATKLLEVDYSRDGYTLKGYIGDPSLTRGNRSYESFYINGRYIKSTVVSDAVEDACKNRVMVGKFPVYVLNLTVPDGTVDVNVHPTKLEVRFSDDAFIYDFINTAITQALAGEQIVPQVEWDSQGKTREKSTQLEISPESYAAVYYPSNEDKDDSEIWKRLELAKQKPRSNKPFDPATATYEEKLIKAEELLTKYFTHGGENLAELLQKAGMDDEEHRYLISKRQNDEGKLNESDEFALPRYTASELAKNGLLDEMIDRFDNDEDVKPAEPLIPNKSLKKVRAEERKPIFYSYKIIGQIFSTYWIIEQDNKMYMIDQHAAHERVLYEELTKKLKNSEAVSQLLLEPAFVRVNELERQCIEDNRKLIEEFGFEFASAEGGYTISSVPYIFTKYDYLASFTDIVDELLKNGSITSIYDTRLDAVAMMSCKAAVKAHDRLTEQEARELIKSLLTLENPFNCPHGRPTIIEMTRYELEKKFKRIQD